MAHVGEPMRKQLQVTTLEKYIEESDASQDPASILRLVPVLLRDSAALLNTDLIYSKPNVMRRIRYRFERNLELGDARFDHWLFVQGNFIT